MTLHSAPRPPSERVSVCVCARVRLRIGSRLRLRVKTEVVGGVSLN